MPVMPVMMTATDRVCTATTAMELFDNLEKQGLAKVEESPALMLATDRAVKLMGESEFMTRLCRRMFKP